MGPRKAISRAAWAELMRTRLDAVGLCEVAGQTSDKHIYIYAWICIYGNIYVSIHTYMQAHMNE